MIARAQARGKVIKTLGKESQYGSGQGFDEVFFEFDAAGRAQVVIVEVKNYPGRHVPTEDFTAVLDNLEQNFDRLYKQLEDEAKFIRREMQLVQDGLKAAPDPSRLGLSLAEVESALEAIIEQNVSLHIRLGAGTKLGTFTAGSVIKNIKKAWADLGIRSRVPIKVMTIQKTLIDEAVVDVQTIIKRDFIGTRPKFYKVTDAAESLGAVKGPFKAGVGDVFVDSTGKLATMRTVKEADIVGTARDELASEIVERLAKPMMHPHTTAQAPLTVLLDVSALTPKARQELQAALEQAVARLKTEKSVLKRLHQITNVP